MQSIFVFILALAALTTAHPYRYPISGHRRLNGTYFNPNTSNGDTTTDTTTDTSTNPTTSDTTTNTGVWQPPVGATWQIILYGSLPQSSITNPTASVYDIDLFENPASTISTLHDAGTKVICYFSAGTREDWREDADSFTSSDLGADMADWEGETWVDLRSDNVRSIMAKRLDIAKEKGCDAVDPDNVDAYGNDQGGIGLTEDDTVDFMNWLSGEAHSRGLSIGLKNAGAIIPKVLDNMEFSVNEQCSVYNECDVYMPFVEQGKPVFQIEYPKGDEVNNQMEVFGQQKQDACEGYRGEGTYSTLIKNMNLDEWVQVC